MAAALPKTLDDRMSWTWPQIEPHYLALERRTLNARNAARWLADWSRLHEHVSEMAERLYVATTVNTADKQAEQRYTAFLDTIVSPVEAAEQRLKAKLLASGCQPRGFAIQLRNMRTEAALYREENLPLNVKQDKMCNEYDKIAGAQTILWEGKELTPSQAGLILQDNDRSKREQAWRLVSDRWLQDRQAVSELWRRFMRLRLKISANAGFGDDYRAYRWQLLHRYDYTPADCRTFQDAIEKVAVPAATRIFERRRKKLGLATLRPWDLDVDAAGLPPLRPFASDEEYKAKTSAIFHAVDPALGQYFDIMRKEGLLDLDSRKGKAPGGYCDSFAVARRPFIFMNAVGVHNDVTVLLHEGGHAFHVFERSALPYIQQHHTPMEFNEVASMSMEMLASPYLAATSGGFYSEKDAARAIVEHLESWIVFWPYMAIVDAFQHWVYEHPQAAQIADECDAAWAALWQRFRPGVDWSGLDQEMMTGWQRKLHIHQRPFYYIEYGLAQLGAVQVWGNALKNQAGAVAAYRKALALGGTVTLPKLFATAGARLAFDARTLGAAVNLMETTIDKLAA